jgi:hypothetical protein
VLPAVDRAVRDRTGSGPVGTAELRLLVAHARMVDRILADLGPAGVEAARNTLIELTRAARSGSSTIRSRLSPPSLVQAAKDLAVRRRRPCKQGVQGSLCPHAQGVRARPGGDTLTAVAVRRRCPCEAGFPVAPLLAQEAVEDLLRHARWVVIGLQQERLQRCQEGGLGDSAGTVAAQVTADFAGAQCCDLWRRTVVLRCR